MIPRATMLALLLAAAAVAGCQRSRGGATTAALPTATPDEAALQAIPLGQPPGQPTSPATEVRNPYEGDASAVEQGRALFGAMNCVYCHGAQGSGLIGPALDSPAWRYGGSPAQLYNSIHDGRPQGMPAWGARLPPDQIWKLVAYLESLGGASAPATPQMAKIGGPQPSTTGPEPADQVQADTAHQALVDADQRRGGG